MATRPASIKRPPRSHYPTPAATEHAVRVIEWVCYLAGSPAFIQDVRRDIGGAAMQLAIERHDTAAIFDWLAQAVSFQGVSDRSAETFLARHGGVTWSQIAHGLEHAGCPKLQSYWHFHGCRYHKGNATCAEPHHYRGCPLPKHPLRNGRLNQTAYSLYFFIRDVAGGDLVAWIDRRLKATRRGDLRDRPRRMSDALIEPLREVYGVSDKVLAMCLSALLLGAYKRRRRWFAAGASMIAIDTLVHAFLHRSGILRSFGAEHAYGQQCYGPNGCATLVWALSERIDAQSHNLRFPRHFPRFVQHAVWSYCAEAGNDICNGNRIDDRKRCGNISCVIYGICSRIKLK